MVMRLAVLPPGSGHVLLLPVYHMESSDCTELRRNQDIQYEESKTACREVRVIIKRPLTFLPGWFLMETVV